MSGIFYKKIQKSGKSIVLNLTLPLMERLDFLRKYFLCLLCGAWGYFEQSEKYPLFLPNRHL